MHRPTVSIATLVAAAALVLTGCPEEQKPAAGTTGGTPAAKTTGAAAAGTGTAAAAKPSGGAGKMGEGVIKGVVNFTGEAPEMKVPSKRKDQPVCKDKEVVHNAVITKDGKIQDVLIYIGDGQLTGYTATGPAKVDQVDCNYVPRIQALLPDQTLQVLNSDATLHNVHAKFGTESKFNQAQQKGAPPIEKSFEDTGIYRLQCDVHSWMRAFVVVTENPFNAVSGADGTFTIEKVPDGKYTLTAWHSQYGKKEKKDVEVKAGTPADVTFEYDGTEDEPPENQGELNDM